MANDTDKDGDRLSISKVGKADNGKVKLAKNGSIIFTPDKDFTGQASFEYTIDDGNKGRDSATVTVQVKKANRLPIAKDDNVRVLPKRSFHNIQPERLLENDKDKDGDKLTITKVSNATKGKVKLTKSGQITFTPDDYLNFIDGSFKYTISDGKGGKDTAKVKIGLIRDIKRSNRSGNLDPLTGGEDNQRFVYDDLINVKINTTSVDVGNDVILLGDLLDSVLDRVGYEGTDAIADQYLRVASEGTNRIVQIDPDGPDGILDFQSFLHVEGVTATQKSLYF